MRRVIRCLALGSTLGATACVGSTPETGAEWLRLAVAVPPAPVPIEGSSQLVYELSVVSLASDTLTLAAVKVMDASSRAVLGEFGGGSLEAILGPAGHRSVAPGDSAIVYVNLVLPDAGTPRALAHVVELDAIPREGPRSARIEGGRVRIDDKPLPRLAPPLRGGPWVAVYHPSWERGHRRVVYVTDGRARIPGRFAIDWMASGDSGNGAEVLAVADAVVAAARGDMPNPKECADRPPSRALDDEAGNYIVLDLGRGRYAFYEHLRHGVLVRKGDRVRQGQIIGALGCTGSSPKPHLHFHVGDGPVPLAAEGMPYLLTDWRSSGVHDSAAGPSLPGPNVVVWFRGK
jgi:hypothetical protein